MKHDVQVRLALEFTKALPLVRQPILKEVRLGRTLFAAEPLILLAGYIIQYGAVDEPDPNHVMDAFINSILMLNELYGCEQIDIQQAAGASLESFMTMELRAAALDDEPMDHLVGRLHAFVKWARDENSAARTSLDIDAAFIEMFGYTYEDITAAGLLVHHYFRSIDSVPQLKTLDPIVDVEFLVAPLAVKDPIRAFMCSYSIPIDDLALVLSQRDRMTAAALLPLQKRPLIDLGSGLYACPSLTFLSATLGIGLFHRLAEYYGARNGRHKFYHFFARFLQVYAEQTIAHSVRNRSARVVPEFEYWIGKKRHDSSDVILIEERTALFFDVCNKRLNTELSLNAANLPSMHADIDGMILTQAKQLDGRIADFRAGRYTINGFGIADIDTIIPVAITHQSIHGWAATRRFIDRRLRELNYLQLGPRLEIISIAELETLIQAYDGHLSYAELLTARRSNPSELSRARSLKNYLLLDAGWDGKDKCDNARFAAWFQDVAISKLASWGFH